MDSRPVLPPWFVLDPLIQQWVLEDVGRGDRTTQALVDCDSRRKAQWIAKESGQIAGLPVAHRVFQLLDADAALTPLVSEGETVSPGVAIATIQGSLTALLSGERVALNLVMRMSGIATAARQYVDCIADYATKLADTRKVTPGLRLLEKYASQVGGASNHRFGLDDAVMIKDNHIAAAGSITAAIAQVRATAPYPLTIEVETETLAQVQEALAEGADIIMLDNMSLELMQTAVTQIRQFNPKIRIEASGNVTLSRLRAIAQTGVDYISSSAPITRSNWLDISMRLLP